MKVYASFLFIIFFSNGYALSSDFIPKHLIFECSILDKNGKIIKRYPGGICQFYDDGSFISGQCPDKNKIIYYNNNLKILWQKTSHCHHQINKSHDGNKILVLDSSFHNYHGKKTRFDKLRILDLQGNEIKSFDFYQNRKEFAKLFNNKDMPPVTHYKHRIFQNFPSIKSKEKKRTPPQAPRPYELRPEFSHANSFYEIGPNSNQDKIEAFQPGNYIISDHNLAIIFILNSSLEKILWSIPYPDSGVSWSGMHDVQVLKDGKLLIYANSAPNSLGKYSSIINYDPLTKKITTLYKHKEPTRFFSNRVGGVQALDENKFLISDITDKVGKIQIVKSPDNILFSTLGPAKGPDGKPRPFQQVKGEDLSSFLKNNVGL